MGKERVSDYTFSMPQSPLFLPFSMPQSPHRVSATIKSIKSLKLK